MLPLSLSRGTSLLAVVVCYWMVGPHGPYI